MINQFNINQEPWNKFISIDNRKAIFNPDNSDGTGKSSAIASVLSGHFDTSSVNVRTSEGKKNNLTTELHRVTRIKKTDLLRETPCPPWLVKNTI